MSRPAAGIHKAEQECGPSPPRPSDHILGSGAVLFPGVFDQHGCPLVIFQVEGQDSFLELCKEEVVDFIHYLHALLNQKPEKQSLVSVVADLRNASSPTIKFITETLLLLEEHKRTVSSVYIIQPKRKDAVKLLLKLLVPSKSFTISFRNILLKEIPDLWNYIDRSQLPATLGGYFLYCHSSWVSFIKEIDGFVQEFLSVVQRLPSCISTLQALSRLPLPSDFNELQHFCSTNEAKFQQLRRELGLDELLRHCETVCEKLRHPDKDPCYQSMAGTPFFTRTAFDMVQNHSRIIAAVEKVELLWRQSFANTHLQLQVLQLHNNALKIIMKMETLQEKVDLYRMEIAKDSTTAAMLLSEFEASIHTPAMAAVRCAEDLIHTLEEIVPVRFQTREGWVLDLERKKEKLHSGVHHILQSLRGVSNYHHYSNKASRWYSLVLSDSFLPELLSGVQQEQQSFRRAPAWRQSLSAFLKKNPPPDMEELLCLSHLSSSIPDDKMQQAGRLFSQRCMILRKLLVSTGPVPVEQLQLALQWQYDLLRRSHETLNPESDEEERKGLKRSPSELNDIKYGNRPEAGNHPAICFQPDWGTQLEASGGKDDVGNSQKSTGVSDPMKINHENISDIIDIEHNTKEFGSGPAANFSSASIQIIPKVEAESLNLEIKVKRSASPPTNPWLSLPVDNLESSYTVTITPKATPQKNEASWKQRSDRDLVAEPESGSCDWPAYMEEFSCNESTETQRDWMLHGHSDSGDPELSHVCNILSSTITSERDESICTTEGVPTLLWDSYDLHDEKPESDSMLDMPLADWEVKEEENLKEVERILKQADGILEEEENVLVQEAVLDALLRGDENDPWPKWHSEAQHEQASIEMTEPGVQNADHCQKPRGADQLSEVVSTKSMKEREACYNLDDAEEPLDGRLDLSEMSVNILNQQRLEESLKIHELRQRKVGKNDQPSEGTEESNPDREPELLPEGPGSGCNAAMKSNAQNLEEKLSRPQGHSNTGSECELALCDTFRVSGCELKESSVIAQPQSLCGNKINRCTQCSAGRRLISEVMPHDGECDPGGKLTPSPVLKPETGSPPVNILITEQETHPTSKASQPATSRLSIGSGYTQPDPKSEALGIMLASVRIDERSDFIYQNVNEQINNNLLANGSDGCFSEMTGVDKDDRSIVPAGPLQTNVHHTEVDLQSVPQNDPNPAPKFYPAAKQEFNEGFHDDILSSDSVRISHSVAQTQLMEDNIVEIADFKVPVVLDVGSGFMKAGLANQDRPSIIFPTITGVPKYEEILNGTLERDVYIGHDAQHMRGILTLKHPVKNGIICNWEDMEKIWHYTFQQLSVDPEDHPVLLTEAAMNPLQNRQRMVEIMFERFRVPFAYVAMQAVLALYAAGRTTGVVFDSGEGVSHSVPVFEGYCLPHAVQRFPLAGLDVSMQLKKLLQEQGVCMRTTAEDEIVREMKEKCCCVALNYEAELNPERSFCREMQYTMPDGQIITLGTERFRAPEILFKPEMIGRDHYGMHESIFKSIVQSDIDLRHTFLDNIVLSGGNTLLPGLPERLKAEIKNLVPASMRVNVCVTSPKDRNFLVWSGGAVLASLSTFTSAWISQDEYEEYGPQIVFRKCF